MARNEAVEVLEAVDTDSVYPRLYEVKTWAIRYADGQIDTLQTRREIRDPADIARAIDLRLSR